MHKDLPSQRHERSTPVMNVWSGVGLLGIGLMLGIGIGTQTRTALAIRAHLNVPPARVQELGYRLHQQERAREALQERVHQLRQQISEYQQGAAAQQPKLDALNGQLTRLKAAAGLTALEGPGVIVELFDSTEPLRPGQDPNERILHNYEVAWIVNELWAAGAEAISVNGERIAGRTAIQSTTTTMTVNAKRIAPPIQIMAIGDPTRLAEFVLRRGGPLEFLQAFTFPARVRRADRVIIPPYKGTFPFKHARLQPENGR